MIALNGEKLIEIVEGSLVAGKINKEINSISIDSRKIENGQLFLAIRGECFDGHRFVKEALKRGAAGALISEAGDYQNIFNKFIIRVKDTQKALGKLAENTRLSTNSKVIGMTGSTGKTSVRDMLNNILSQGFKVVCSRRNYNNEIGLPLTLLRADKETEVIIVEMAMRGVGQIKELCKVAHPQIGMITNIGLTHIELLGTQEKIALVKKELIDFLGEEDIVILNRDDPWTDMVQKSVKGKLITFGLSESADVRAEDISFDEFARPSFVLVLPDGKIFIKLPFIGIHQIQNALSASAAALAFQINAELIKSGLENTKAEKMRMELIKTKEGIFVINDSYNASPVSMKAALNSFSIMKGFKRKIAVLGDMLELGDVSEYNHREVGKYMRELKIDYLVTVGKLSSLIEEEFSKGKLKKVNTRHFCSNKETADFLKGYIRDGDGILFKASRVMAFEEIIEMVKNR